MKCALFPLPWLNVCYSYYRCITDTCLGMTVLFPPFILGGGDGWDVGWQQGQWSNFLHPTKANTASRQCVPHIPGVQLLLWNQFSSLCSMEETSTPPLFFYPSIQPSLLLLFLSLSVCSQFSLPKCHSLEKWEAGKGGWVRAGEGREEKRRERLLFFLKSCSGSVWRGLVCLDWHGGWQTIEGGGAGREL